METHLFQGTDVSASVFIVSCMFIVYVFYILYIYYVCPVCLLCVLYILYVSYVFIVSWMSCKCIAQLST